MGIIECVLMASLYGLPRFDRELAAACGEANGAVWFHAIRWSVSESE